jgi:SAM-dependent methyltransferase
MSVTLEELLPVLACPACRAGLAADNGALRCGVCGSAYPLLEGVPQLVTAPPGDGSGLPYAPIKVGDAGWVGAAKRLVRVPSPTFETAEIRRQIPAFVASFPADARLINVGSASLRHGARVLNVDLLPGPGVDVVGDATRLPFGDDTLDGIISRRVLEHVRKPGLAVEEMLRVLKPGGRVWCEIPFLQGYHPTPTDYQRYTRAGLADLFDQFEIVELGVALGPSSTLSWILREYLAILFSFNNAHLYKIGERVFSWLTLPVKFLDGITARSRFAPQIASSFYVIARKPETAP